MAEQAGEASMVVTVVAVALLMVLAGLAKKRLEWRQRQSLWEPLRRCGHQRRRSNK